MPGVIVEIDAVLNQQSLKTLGADLDQAGTLLGTGIAKGANPAAISFSKQLITTLQTRLKAESGVLAKQLAEGALSPAQYSAASQRLGKSIIADLNKGIKSGAKLDLFQGEGGLAVRNQLGAIALTARQTGTAIRPIPVELDKIPPAATKAAQGLTTLRGGLASFVLSTTGAPGPIGRIATGLLLFAGGGSLVLTVAAGLAAIAFAFNLLGKAATESRKATDEAIKAAQSANLSALSEVNRLGLQIAELEKRRAEAVARSGKVGLIGVAGDMLGVNNAPTEDLQRIKDIDRELTGLRASQIKAWGEDKDKITADADAIRDKEGQFLAELYTVVTASATTATTAIVQQIGVLKAKFAEVGASAGAETRAAFDAAIGALETQLAGAALGESLSKQFQEIEGSIVDGLTHAGLQTISGEIDALLSKAEAALEYLTPGPSKARTDLEGIRNTIAAKRVELQKRGVDLAQEEWDIARGSLITAEDLVKAHNDRLQALRAQAQLIEDSARGALQLAEAFGLVDANLADVLSSLVQVGSNIRIFTEQLKTFRAGTKGPDGKPLVGLGDVATAALPIAGGVASAIKGIGGLLGDSPQVVALKAAIEANEAALRENTKILEVSGGAAGFSSTSKALDEVLTGKYKLLEGPADYEISRDELDIALRKEGSSFRELEAAANDLGIDISILTDTSLAQLQEKMGDVDIAAIREAEAQEALAVSMGAAADSMARARTQAEQWSDLLDTDDPLTAAQQRLGARGAAGGVGSSERRALGEIANLDLGSEAGRTIADRLLKEKFANAETLTVEQRGGLSVDAFRDLLVEWEHILDEIRANEADTRRNNEQEAVNQRTEAEQQAAFADLQKRAGVLGGPAAQAAAEAARLIAEAIALGGGALGEDSPLAQDARRRADAAVAEAERLVDAGEQARGEKITPGFTVSRVITETSAGRLIGELTTQTIYLKDIRDLIAGGRPVGTITDGGASAGVPVIENHLYIDGRELSDVVSTRQFQSYQNRTLLQGNAGSRS